MKMSTKNIEKERTIRDLGYNLVVCWDFERDKYNYRKKTSSNKMVYDSKINGIHANAFSENGVPVGEKVILKLVPVLQNDQNIRVFYNEQVLGNIEIKDTKKVYDLITKYETTATISSGIIESSMKGKSQRLQILFKKRNI